MVEVDDLLGRSFLMLLSLPGALMIANCCLGNLSSFHCEPRKMNALCVSGGVGTMRLGIALGQVIAGASLGKYRIGSEPASRSSNRSSSSSTSFVVKMTSSIVGPEVVRGRDTDAEPAGMTSNGSLVAEATASAGSEGRDPCSACSTSEAFLLLLPSSPLKRSCQEGFCTIGCCTPLRGATGFGGGIDTLAAHVIGC